MRAKLTKTFVDGLQPDPDPRKRLTVWDTELPAFGVMVTPVGPRGGGSKSYIVQYRVGGRGSPTRRVTIGRHGREWQPAPARDEAREILRQVRRGVDPFVQRRDDRESGRLAELGRREEEERAERLLFPAFRVEFVEEYAKQKQKGSWKNTERALKEFDQRFSRVRIDEMKRDLIKWALQDIMGRSEGAAIHAHKALRKMFNWATAEQIITPDKHPMVNFPAPAKAKARKRVLTSTELREVWFAAEAQGYPFGSHIKGLIITGQRRSEVGRAPWGELYLKERFWLIAEERRKGERDAELGDHLVPLGDLGVQFFSELPRIAPPEGVKLRESDRPVFTTSGRVPISGFSKKKQELEDAIDAARREVLEDAGGEWDDEDSPMPHWTGHDMRRTQATVLQALGVEEKIIHRLHGQRIPGEQPVARHYQHWAFQKEKAAAVALWEKYLRGAIFGDPRFKKLVDKADYRLVVGQ